MKNDILIFLLCFVGFSVVAQETDEIYVESDSLTVDTTAAAAPKNVVMNSAAIDGFFRKLEFLEQTKSGKVNIVHIGDSHIQADLMTAQTRRELQQVFGNAGRGFVFPHNLAKTNGSSDIRFSSNGKWDSHRNIYPPNGSEVGLSGIALETRSADFAIEFDAKIPDNAFNTIKIITPNNEHSFDLATAKETIVLESKVPKNISHKIRSGEALSIIADKYNVSVNAIKKLNNLKSNNIRAGKSLRIPSREMEVAKTERYKFIPLPLVADSLSHSYYSDVLLDKIYLIPAEGVQTHNLNGIVLENGGSGILYHSIGVNGAKLSDYNKYSLFFTQLKSLSPDLIIVSLGTNESFDKITAEEYEAQLRFFLQNIRKDHPQVSLLVISPPPSLFQRKYPNTFADAYSKSILTLAEENRYSVYDLFSQLGGLNGVSKNSRAGLIAADKVHYTKAGYEYQGSLLAKALLDGFAEFKLFQQ